MSIILEQVTKLYGGVPVVNDVSLDIGDGEFFVLLGPSGSGKSTLLRTIAGLSGVEQGRISLHGRDVTNVAARKRGVGLVFQNYALFRHLTVAENIEFALRVRHVRAAVRRQRRQELLRLVALEGFDQRLPAQLSGGQQQRVAVARALAHKPEVLLLDEPFGALDAKIREELRRTIRQVQRELGITTVLVTHDQEEAFTMADRIGIMNYGRLLETGAPRELYAHPDTRFVATFLGAANLLLARRSDGAIHLGSRTLAAAGHTGDGSTQEVVVVVRPEEIELAAAPAELGTRFLAHGMVDEVVSGGALENLRLRLENGAPAPLLTHGGGDGDGRLQVTRSQHEQRAFQVQRGQRVAVGVRRLHVLPTPLSSFTACAVLPALTAELSRQPLLAELAARMKTRVLRRTEPRLGAADAPGTPDEPFVGTTVIAARDGSTECAAWLLRRGARDVLVLPPQAALPAQVLIHSLDEAARGATRAVSASLLHHLAAEEVHVDDLSALAQPGAPAQLLIVGVSEPERLAEVGELLEAGRAPLLIVYHAAP